MNSQMQSLVVEPAAGPRNRIRAAISSERSFLPPYMSLSIDEANRVLEFADTIDLIFVSTRVGMEEALSFIGEAKKKTILRDAAFILLADGNVESSSVAEIMLKGVDGFLIEPYSVEQLTEVSKIAERVRLEHRSARFQKAGLLLVKEIIDQIDQLSSLVKAGRSASISKAVLQDLCGAVHQLEPELQAQFLSQVVDIFSSIERAPTTSRVNARSYTGASERVRKKMADRALNNLRQAVGA